MFAPAEEWEAATSWVKRKSKIHEVKTKEPWEDERAKLPKCAARWLGLSSRRACAREKPTAVSLQPPKASVLALPRAHAHTHSRTHSPGAGSGGTSAGLAGAARTRPTPAVAPRLQATPPTLHP